MSQIKEDMIDIAIVDGGVAGLYCAWKLKKSGKSVHLYEGAQSAGFSVLGQLCGQCRFPRRSRMEGNKCDGEPTGY